MLMTQLQQRQTSERSKLSPVDANLKQVGGQVSDADSGGFSDADVAARR